MSRIVGFAKSNHDPLALYRATQDKLDPVALENLDADDTITLFLYPTDGACYDLEVPPGKLSDLERATAFMLEESLASPPEEVFVSLSKPRPGGSRLVFVTSVSVLDTVSAHPDLQGRNWELVSPFNLLVRGEAAGFDDCAIFNDGSRYFAIDDSLPEDFQDHVIEAFLTLEDKNIHGVKLAHSLRADPASGHTGLAWCAMALSGAAVNIVDLRQGKYAPKRIAAPPLESLRGLALGLLLVCFGWVGVKFLELQSSRNLSDNLTEKIAEISAQIAPEAGTPRNASEARELRSELVQVERMDGLDMMTDLYAALNSVDGVAIEEVIFNRDLGRLQATIVYAEFGLDTQLKEILDSAYAVKLGDSRSRGGLVVGNLILEGEQ